MALTSGSVQWAPPSSSSQVLLVLLVCSSRTKLWIQIPWGSQTCLFLNVSPRLACLSPLSLRYPIEDVGQQKINSLQLTGQGGLQKTHSSC